MNSYELSRNWFDWAYENPDKISPNHGALFFYIIEHCNRLGWKEKFGLPTNQAKDAIGIKSYNTYIKTMNDLVEWGFIKLLEKSQNQYTANIIAISNFDKPTVKALDKALINLATKQPLKQYETTSESIDSIIKPQTINHYTYSEFVSFINTTMGRTFKSVNQRVKASFSARLKEGWTRDQIETAVKNASKDEFHIKNKYKYLTPEFLCRADKLDRFSQPDTHGSTLEGPLKALEDPVIRKAMLAMYSRPITMQNVPDDIKQRVNQIAFDHGFRNIQHFGMKYFDNDPNIKEECIKIGREVDGGTHEYCDK